MQRSIERAAELRRGFVRGRAGAVALLLVCGGLGAASDNHPPQAPPKTPAPRPRGSGFSYHHAEEPQPWSIHILKVDRSRTDLSFHTTTAGGPTFGLTTLTEQLNSLPRSLGQPVGAINGDFWRDGRQPAGDPMGLQIRQGEVVSAPAGRPCLWFDAAGQPRTTNVQSQFTVTWPNERTTPFGLNEERTNGSAVLYTPAVGASTQCRGGRELVLERAGDAPWLPLRVGHTLTARVREVRDAGDTKLSADTLVLSLSPAVVAGVPAVAPGATLTLTTATTPELRDIHTALGGGPTLVRDGKVVTFSGSQPRHPRTAVGWNDTNLFLLVVDGRQHKLSVGMSLPELAEYMRTLGCTQALNLDGGGSSTFWVHGQVMNSPCYGKERPMANALILVRNPAPTGAARPGAPTGNGE